VDSASCAIVTEPREVKHGYRAGDSTEKGSLSAIPVSALPSILFAFDLSQLRLLSVGARRYAVMTRGLLCRLVLSATLASLAGCSSVSQRVEEQRPFFQPEYDLTSHGRKTLFDRLVELDPGGLHVKVASDYERNAPLRIAVLPFTDRGSANFVVDKIPLTFRDRQQRASWAWTDAQRLRRSMLGYLAGREFYILNPIGIDAVLQSHGITDEASLERIAPQKLGSWLGVDAVVYGEVVHYEAYYLALLSGWQVSVRGGMVSTHNGEQLVSFYGSRYDMNFSPALDPGYSDQLRRIAITTARHRAGTFGARGLPGTRAADSRLRESAPPNCPGGARDRPSGRELGDACFHDDGAAGGQPDQPTRKRRDAAAR
jgi:hypothetical protein